MQKFSATLELREIKCGNFKIHFWLFQFYSKTNFFCKDVVFVKLLSTFRFHWLIHALQKLRETNVLLLSRRIQAWQNLREINVLVLQTHSGLAKITWNRRPRPVLTHPGLTKITWNERPRPSNAFRPCKNCMNQRPCCPSCDPW